MPTAHFEKYFQAAVNAGVTHMIETMDRKEEPVVTSLNENLMNMFLHASIYVVGSAQDSQKDREERLENLKQYLESAANVSTNSLPESLQERCKNPPSPSLKANDLYEIKREQLQDVARIAIASGSSFLLDDEQTTKNIFDPAFFKAGERYQNQLLWHMAIQIRGPISDIAEQLKIKEGYKTVVGKSEPPNQDGSPIDRKLDRHE